MSKTRNGILYSIVDNLILQTKGWFDEIFLGVDGASVKRWKDSVEEQVLEKGSTNETAFYQGQIIGDAIQTAFVVTNLPALLKSLVSGVQGLVEFLNKGMNGAASNPGGYAYAFAGGGELLAYAETVGVSASDAEAIAEAVGMVGAFVVLAMGDITGVGNDYSRLQDALKGKADSYKKYDSTEIEKKYGLNKGGFHREVKPDILSDLTSKDSPYKDLMKKMGNNPDIYLSSEGQIEIVSTQFKGKSFVTDLNIADFLP